MYPQFSLIVKKVTSKETKDSKFDQVRFLIGPFNAVFKNVFGVCVVYNIAARYEFILQVYYSRINKLIQTIL